MKLYRINNWNERFENNRTRELKKMDWVPFPNKQDGDGYTLLMEQKNGAALFGAWVACVQIASRCEPRGLLVRDGGKPHDPQSLARMSRLPAGIIEQMLEILSTPDINWLISEEYNNPAGGCGNPAGGCLEGKGREGKEEKGSGDDSPSQPDAKTEAKELTDSEWLESLKKSPAYDGIDVAREHAKMTVWCSNNGRQPSRRRFINWLNRCEKPMRAMAQRKMVAH